MRSVVKIEVPMQFNPMVGSNPWTVRSPKWIFVAATTALFQRMSRRISWEVNVGTAVLIVRRSLSSRCRNLRIEGVVWVGLGNCMS